MFEIPLGGGYLGWFWGVFNKWGQLVLWNIWYTRVHTGKWKRHVHKIINPYPDYQDVPSVSCAPQQCGQICNVCETDKKLEQVVIIKLNSIIKDSALWLSY